MIDTPLASWALCCHPKMQSPWVSGLQVESRRVELPRQHQRTKYALVLCIELWMQQGRLAGAFAKPVYCLEDTGLGDELALQGIFPRKIG